MRVSRLVLAVTMLLVVGSAHAQLGDPPPREIHARFTNTFGIGANELLGGLEPRFFAYIPYGNSDSFLFGQTHVRAGAWATITPAFVRAGPFVGISPALFLDIDVGYQTLFDWQAQFTESMDSKIDPSRLREIPTEFVLGHMYIGQAVFKAMAGPVVLLSTTQGIRWEIPRRYYNLETYGLLEPGWSLKNHSILGVIAADWIIAFTEFQIFRYYPTGYEKTHVGIGMIFPTVIPDSLLYVMGGQHLYNEYFDGWKIVVAVLTDMAIPIRK